MPTFITAYSLPLSLGISITVGIVLGRYAATRATMGALMVSAQRGLSSPRGFPATRS